MQDGRHRHPDLREYISELTTLLRRQCPPHLARIGGTATRQRVSRFASNQALCFPRRRIVDGQCPLMANVGFGCSRSDGRWDRDLCGGRAVAKAGRENPVGNATCATERLARVDIPADCARTVRCGGRGREKPVGNATCATERLAQVDIPTDFCPGGVARDRFPTDSAPVVCRGRYFVRFHQGRPAAEPPLHPTEGRRECRSRALVINLTS